jgi:hypothetical protein
MAALPVLIFLRKYSFINRDEFIECSDRSMKNLYTTKKLSYYVSNINGAITHSFLQAINDATRDGSPELGRACLEVANASDGLLDALGYVDVPLPVEGALPDLRLGLFVVPHRPLMREIARRTAALGPKYIQVKYHSMEDIYQAAYDLNDLKYRIDYLRRCCAYIIASPKNAGTRLSFGQKIADRLLMDMITEYLRIFRITPKFVDNTRRPCGRTTLWVHDIIRISAKNLEAHCKSFSSDLPEGPWLKTIRERLLGLDQLKLSTLSKRLRMAWNQVQEEYRSRYGVDIDVSKPWGRLPRRRSHR